MSCSRARRRATRRGLATTKDHADSLRLRAENDVVLFTSLRLSEVFTKGSLETRRRTGAGRVCLDLRKFLLERFSPRQRGPSRRSNVERDVTVGLWECFWRRRAGQADERAGRDGPGKTGRAHKSGDQ